MMAAEFFAAPLNAASLYWGAPVQVAKYLPGHDTHYLVGRWKQVNQTWAAIHGLAKIFSHNPSVHDIKGVLNAAVAHGHIEVLRVLSMQTPQLAAEDGRQTLFDESDARALAIIHGHKDILEMIGYMHTPSRSWYLPLALYGGHPKMIKAFIPKVQKHFLMEEACTFATLRTVKWLHTWLGSPRIAGSFWLGSFLKAAGNGRDPEVLLWLIRLGGAREFQFATKAGDSSEFKFHKYRLKSGWWRLPDDRAGQFVASRVAAAYFARN